MNPELKKWTFLNGWQTLSWSSLILRSLVYILYTLSLARVCARRCDIDVTLPTAKARLILLARISRLLVWSPLFVPKKGFTQGRAVKCYLLVPSPGALPQRKGGWPDMGPAAYVGNTLKITESMVVTLSFSGGKGE